MKTIEEEAIELLVCAADGSFQKDTRCKIDPSVPSLAGACAALDYESSAVGKLAFAAVDMADPDYGESFAHLYLGEINPEELTEQEIEDRKDDARREGMRHAFLEAAQLIREGKANR